jgi:hypothetical protein
MAEVGLEARIRRWAGYIAHQTNAKTGAVIVVATAAEQQLDPAGGKYVTVCDTHSAILNSRSKKAARAAMAFPEWCEECSALLWPVLLPVAR